MNKDDFVCPYCRGGLADTDNWDEIATLIEITDHLQYCIQSFIIEMQTGVIT